MNKKKKSTQQELPARPRALGFLIVAAGAFSTWYWYKPLPHSANEASTSYWDHGDGNWTDTGLIRPSLSDLNDPTLPESNSAPQRDSSLELVHRGLMPAPPMKMNLDSLLAAESLPKSPEIDISKPSVVGQVRPWVLNPDSSSRVKPDWPDQPPSSSERTAEANRTQSSSPFATKMQPPQLLDAGSRKIQSMDEDAPQARPGSETNGSTPFSPAAPRIPQYIHQPKRN